ncbi:Putative extracellular nuclease, EndA/NucM family [Mycoplasmopsis bovirhinis]|uniref:endonuclease n=1 Tax=Mycoplasmopsis bovirhinis TaxID=29553 RepID=UPI000BB9DAFA|nr:endonuclease [Mycoplasmopsis bovirhinis]BBA22446.1 Putative extracellular nuclease, EndA/NucM family [Mycoplasmopsis bovirhinis]
MKTKITKLTKKLTFSLLSLTALPLFALSCTKKETEKPEPTPIKVDPNITEANSYKTTYNEVLNKTETTVRENDETNVNNALNAYNALNEGAKANLTDEKTLLDKLVAKITELKKAKAKTTTEPKQEEPKTPSNQDQNKDVTSLNMYQLWETDDIGATFDKLLEEYKNKQKTDKVLKEMQNYGPNSNTEQNYYLSIAGSGGKPETAILKLKDGFDYKKLKGTVPKKDRRFYAEFNETTRELKITYSYDGKEYQDTIIIPVAKTANNYKDQNQNPLTKQENQNSNNIAQTQTLSKEELLAKHNDNLSKYNLVYDPSNNYYASLEGKSGEELLTALVQLQTRNLSTLASKNYDGLKGFYDQYAAFKDAFYENNNSILDIYSENPNGADPYEYTTYSSSAGSSASNEGQGMNREHLIPQSWFNKATPTVHDAHFVWPSDIRVNALRANYPHGNVVTTRTTTQNGAKLGTDQESNTVFEPVDAFKGDIARAYFYFMITHKDKLVDTQNHIFLNQYSNTSLYLKQTYFNYYLQWDINDYVSKFDVVRNNETYKYQNNRNPFIDYPDLILKITGDDTTPFTNKGVLIDISSK